MRRAGARGAAVGAIGLVALAYANGVVIGRDPDGPLRVGAGNGGMVVPPGDRPLIEDAARVDGGAVTVESARPAFISPGLELVGPVAGMAGRDGMCVGCEGPWPPPGSSPLRRVADGQVVVTGMRAPEPGIYYLRGIRYRYRRGVRRFDEVDGTRLCFLVVARHQSGDGCRLEARPERFEGLAEVGGPSDYGDARFKPDALGGDAAAVFEYRAGKELRVELTITNRGDRPRRVQRLVIDEDPSGMRVDPLPSVPATPFAIAPGASRRVTIRSRFGPCPQQDAGGGAVRLLELANGDDPIELSLPIEIRAPERCR